MPECFKNRFGFFFGAGSKGNYNFLFYNSWPAIYLVTKGTAAVADDFEPVGVDERNVPDISIHNVISPPGAIFPASIGINYPI